MDPNGSRFYLISGKADWDVVVDTTPSQLAGAPPAGGWNPQAKAVTLRPEISLFPRGKRAQPLDPAARRGAACDRFGSWFWIGADQRTLYRAPAGTTRAVVYWQPALTPPARKEVFAQPAQPLPEYCLSGLAVTALHYLVAGIITPSAGGLLVFDLHSGGEPLRLDFPAPFAPFDMAAAPDGGVWVLDRANRRLWGLDRSFRLLPLSTPVQAAPEPGSFSPPGAAPQPVSTPAAAPSLALSALDPTGLELLGDGSLLVLDGPALPGQGSRLFHYQPGPQPGSLQPPAAALPLPGLETVVAPDPSAQPGAARPLVAYDLAFLPKTGDQDDRLVVVERDGNQAIAFSLQYPASAADGLSVAPLAIYLPMHYFGGRALAFGLLPTGEPALFYDVTPFPQKDLSVRWLRLQSIDQPRYARTARLETPVFDSRQPGCVWHRLFLDACIPPETSVKVYTRAGDNYELLASQVYRPEPDPYLRGQGAEIPFWDAFSLDPKTGTASQQPGTGTWETLFQAAAGRFIQIRLELTGNGRLSPAVARLRAYYPRFSYLRSYLPATYADEPESASFTERFLANMEGFYSDLESKITASTLLFDPRSAPAEALDWLAAWVGLVIDPLWSGLGADETLDRRRLFIRFAMRLYERRGTPDGIRFAVLLLLDECMERTLSRLERAAVVPDAALRQELDSLGLPYPNLKDGEAALEDLFFSYVLNEPGRSRVRIVEGWETRPRALADTGVSADDFTQAAHRFSVLIPEDLSDTYTAMVDKIVRLEKPAHTDFDLRRFWDYFLVGQARLGLDTILGEEGRFLSIVLGQSYLDEGYLEAAAPMDTPERAIADRDGPGKLRL